MEIYQPDGTHVRATYYEIEVRLFADEAMTEPVKTFKRWTRYGDGGWVDTWVGDAAPREDTTYWYSWEIVAEQIGPPADHHYMIMH